MTQDSGKKEKKNRNWTNIYKKQKKKRKSKKKKGNINRKMSRKSNIKKRTRGQTMALQKENGNVEEEEIEKESLNGIITRINYMRRQFCGK